MKKLQRLFVTSDWHFGHEKMVELTHRPADFEDRILGHHLDMLRYGDTLINCGDVALGGPGTEAATRLLAGLKSVGVSLVCVRGNHDPSGGFCKLQSMGFDFVCDSIGMRYMGRQLLFTHVPATDMAGVDINVHGHLHHLDGHRGSLIQDGKHILISSELCDYRPVPMDLVLKLGGSPQWVGGRFVRAEGGLAL